MKKVKVLIPVILFTLPVAMLACTQDPTPNPAYLIVDHNCTDISKIPDAWIDSVQANLRLHYAHTSHGGQLTVGLERLESSDAKYGYANSSGSLPTEAGAFCVFDGQESVGYITPDLYWQTEGGMNLTRDVLNHNPTINLSMWSWCTQVDGYTEQQVQEYLDSMSLLESQFPNVTFIYMTGNAQATGGSGYNRQLRNEQIRNYCMNNKKVLFDFADLDAWWYNGTSWEEATYDYEGNQVPVEHEQFNGDEAAHTTYSSCDQKGKAVWWMLARLAGWGGALSTSENPTPAPGFSISQNYPNPFSVSTTVRYTLQNESNLELTIYNIEGQLVKTLFRGKQASGTYTVNWDGKDSRGNMLPSGTYFCRLNGEDGIKTTRAVLFIK